MIAFALSMALLGAVPDLSPVSAPTANGPDVSPVFNTAVALACAGDTRELHFGAGQWAFETCPDPIPCGVKLTGEGNGATLLVLKNAFCPTFISWTGGQEGGGGTRDLTVFAWHGVHAGVALYWQARADLPIGTIAGAPVLRDTNVSGFGTWWVPLYFDGAQRTDCTNACGLRVPMLDNVRVFRGRVVNAVCNNCIGMEWHGGGSYGAHAAVQFYGAQSTGNYLDADIQGLISGIGWRSAR